MEVTSAAGQEVCEVPLGSYFAIGVKRCDAAAGEDAAAAFSGNA